MLVVLKKELFLYFNTKLAWIFAIVFVFLANFITLYINNTLMYGDASMESFFLLHPYLYGFLLPALSMPLVSDESHKGSLDVLFSLPIKTSDIVIGKFLAAWFFSGICLMLTATVWITFNIFASPDNLTIFSGYAASFILAGAFLSLGICLSALTNSQTVAFILTFITIFAFLAISGSRYYALQFFDLVSAYRNMVTGLIRGQDIAFFASFIFLALTCGIVLVERKKA